MRLLLDTHALLWWLADDDHLGERARGLIEDPENEILVSVASLWEMTVKVRVGKLKLDVSRVTNDLSRDGFGILDIRTAHLAMLAGLPMHHRDPFDHLLMAQAIAEDAVFVSEDRWASRYPVRSVACSD